MKSLPKEVLDLFPTWEYRCPVCRTYVEPSVSSCPNCKTVFDEKKWRVPPRFLKNRKAMSKYAHEVLAPKLTEKQRQLLFKYFTEIFSDGFESGNFSAWTSTNGSPEVVSDVKKQGSYSAKFNASGEYCEKTGLSGYDTVYIREYARIGSLSGNGQLVNMLHGRGSAGAIFVLSWYRAGDGTRQIALRMLYPSSVFSYYSYDYAVDTWYCFEVKFVKHSSNGEYRVYLDGEEILAHTGLDTSGATFDRIRAGMSYSDTSLNEWVDCVVVADTYIGPISEGETYTKTWQTDALFKKLAITKTAVVDAAFKKPDITKNFAVDSAFQKTGQIQKQVDSIFKKIDITKTFNIDSGFLKRNIVKSFAVDASFTEVATYTIARQIDTLFKKHDIPKTFAIDTYIGEVSAQTHTKTMGIDAIFSYKVKLPQILGITLDGQLVIPIKKEIWIQN